MSQIKNCYLDVETTGLWPNMHGLIQIGGIIEIDDTEVERFNFHCKPFNDKVIDSKALTVNGITEDQLAEFPDPTKVFSKVINIFGKYVSPYDPLDKFAFIAYNAKFDESFIRQWFKDNKSKFFGSWFWYPIIDTAQTVFEQDRAGRAALLNFKLKTVAAYYGLTIDNSRLHDAMYDIELTRDLYKLVSAHN